MECSLEHTEVMTIIEYQSALMTQLGPILGEATPRVVSRLEVLFDCACTVAASGLRETRRLHPEPKHAHI